METIVVGLLTLLGVVVGAALNNWFSEKGRRKERQDLAQESLINALNDFFLDLTRVHYCILHFKEVSTVEEEMVTFKMLADDENRLTKSGRDLFKAYFILGQYTKSPVLGSLDELNKERRKFEDLMSETYEDYAKLKDDSLNKKLDNQIKKLYEVITRVRSNFLNYEI